MVPYQNWHLDLLTTMATTAKLSLTWGPFENSLKYLFCLCFCFENRGKTLMNGLHIVPYYDCIWYPFLPTKKALPGHRFVFCFITCAVLITIG